MLTACESRKVVSFLPKIGINDIWTVQLVMPGWKLRKKASAIENMLHQHCMLVWSDFLPGRVRAERLLTFLIFLKTICGTEKANETILILWTCTSHPIWSQTNSISSQLQNVFLDTVNDFKLTRDDVMLLFYVSENQIDNFVCKSRKFVQRCTKESMFRASQLLRSGGKNFPKTSFPG